jgi:LCP family protein required for cell wall assembly
MNTRDHARVPADRDLRRARPVRKSRKGRILLISVAAVLTLVLGGAGLFLGRVANSFDNNIATFDKTFPAEAGRPAANGTAKNFLILGSDSRDESLNEDDGGAKTPSNQRSDVMMLVHVPEDRSNVYVMSILRDSWVAIPGHGKNKINAAMAFGGMPLAVRTVESLLDTRIDHVARVDFEGFKGMTDVLGGVDLGVKIPFTSKNVKGYSFHEGVNHADGEAALAFVRERYAFKDGDFQRARNQQIFFSALAAKLFEASTLTNPTKLTGFLNTTIPYLTVDKNMSLASLASLGFELRNVRADNLHFFSIPTSGTGTSANGQSIVKLNAKGVKLVKGALRNGGMDKLIERMG